MATRSVRFGIGLLVLALGCERRTTDSSVPTEPSPADREPTLVVEHGQPPAYGGTFVGPSLRVSFAGPWVLLSPREIGPGAQPIELRATVERREGDAFALQTSVAERYAGDFVRPSDWTLLIEPGSIALAMGDEPLETYTEVVAPILLGPAIVDEVLGPHDPDGVPISSVDMASCLHDASETCRALEADKALVAGCREAQWAVCVAHLDLGEADPTIRAANAAARAIHELAVAVRFAEAVRAAAPPELRELADAVLERALARAQTGLAKLAATGPLPADDPHLPGLEARLADHRSRATSQ